MRRFFIAGCQRSGTTLLRLVLGSHEEILCFDEAVSYDLLRAEAPGTRTRTAERPSTQIVGFKVPRFSEQLTRPIFTDPLYGALPSFYMGDKVVFLFRDVLDVIKSMIKLKEGEEAWIDKYGREILSFMVSQPGSNIGFKSKYEFIGRLGFPSHLVGALYWAMKSQGYFELAKRGLPVLPVRYERFVSDPRVELARICGFLRVPWSDALLSHHLRSHDELDEFGLAIGGTDPKRRIDVNSIRGASQLLTRSQEVEIIQLVQESIDQINAL
jgi:hypothetical protein